MAEYWSDWESQVINDLFPLHRFLGGSEHSGVYLTDDGARGTGTAAIKLIPAHPAIAGAQLAYWKTAAALSHPHLLRILDAGRCELDGRQLLFVVMEYAEQNLSQVLPSRALTVAEVDEMLSPILDALACLHRQGLVQGQLRPSNILAVQDQLKLATDTSRPAGEPWGRLSKTTVYDAPESIRGRISPAGDIWGLGITLVEALTQQMPTWPEKTSEEDASYAPLPVEYAQMVRRCLSRDPAARPTVEDLQVMTHHAPDSAATAASAPEPDVPDGPVPAEASTPAPLALEPATFEAAGSQSAWFEPGAEGIAASQPSELAHASAGIAPQPVAFEPAAADTAPSQPSAPTPLTAGVVASQPATRTPASASAAAPAPAASPNRAPAPPLRAPTNTVDANIDPAPRRRVLLPVMALFAILVISLLAIRLFHTRDNSSHPDPAAQTSTGVNATPATPSPIPPVPAPAPASATDEPASLPPQPAPAASTGPLVRHEEMPKVSYGARATIRGAIKVIIRVTVDSAGDVTGQSMLISGPSRYFEHAAADAARRWKFAPADTGKSRQFLLQFEFTRAGVSGRPVTPRS